MPRIKDPIKYEAWRKAIEEGWKKWHADPANKEAHLAKMKSTCLSPEAQSKKSKKRWAKPGEKERMSALSRTPEHRAKLVAGWKTLKDQDPEKFEKWKQGVTAAVQARWDDPEQKPFLVEKLQQSVGSESAIKKRAESMKQVWANPEYKAKLMAIQATDEWKEKSRQSHIEHYEQNPEARLMISDATKKGMASPEVKQKMRDVANDMWADPQISERLLAFLRSPEKRQRHSEWMKKAFQDPVFKAKWRAATITPENQARLQAARLKPENEVYRLRRLAEVMAMWNRPTSIEIAVQAVLDELKIEYIAQHPIGRYNADFFIPQLNLVLECDGTYWHSSEKDQAHDRKRDAWMMTRGYKIARLAEADINANARAITLAALVSFGFEITLENQVPAHSSSSSSPS